MVTAVILVNVERHKLLEVIDAIMKISGIMEVHSIAGEYDLAAVARVRDNQQLTEIIADKMCRQIDGIQHTKTLVSLGSYFNYDAASAYKLD